MTHDLKGRTKIVTGRGGIEALVTNGALHVVFVTRTGAPAEGYGSAQIKGGVASKGEAQVIAGALKVRII